MSVQEQLNDLRQQLADVQRFVMFDLPHVLKQTQRKKPAKKNRR